MSLLKTLSRSKDLEDTDQEEIQDQILLQNPHPVSQKGFFKIWDQRAPLTLFSFLCIPLDQDSYALCHMTLIKRKCKSNWKMVKKAFLPWLCHFYILLDFSHLVIVVKMSSTGGSDRGADIENRLRATGGEGGRRGWDKWRGSWKHTHYHMESRYQWGFAVWLRGLKPGLCDSLEG